MSAFDQSGYLGRKFISEYESRYERMPAWWGIAAERERVFQGWAVSFLDGRTPLEAELDEVRPCVDLYRDELAKAKALQDESETDAERRHAQHDVDFNQRWFNHYRNRLDDLLLEQAQVPMAHAAE